MNGQYDTGDIVLHDWKLVRLIGEGSYGRVFEARSEEFGETYNAAIKIISIPKNESELMSIRAEIMSDESVTTYFRSVVQKIVNEVVMMSKLKGKTNIVSFEGHKVMQHEDGIGWDIIIRMELLTPLMEYSTQYPFTRQNIIKLGIDMCQALELCQKYDIIHRDIKPENIFVSELGDFELGDFGIARIAERTTHATKIGTFSYMAPEILRGEAYNSSVDLYALGLVLYRLLNDGRAPFLPTYPASFTYIDQENAQSKRISGARMPSPVNADGRLAEIVLKACEYNPKNRHSSPLQMRLELESIKHVEESAPIIFPPKKQSSVVGNITEPPRQKKPVYIPLLKPLPKTGDTGTALLLENEGIQPVSKEPDDSSPPEPKTELINDDNESGVLQTDAETDERDLPENQNPTSTSLHSYKPVYKQDKTSIIWACMGFAAFVLLLIISIIYADRNHGNSSNEVGRISSQDGQILVTDDDLRYGTYSNPETTAPNNIFSEDLDSDYSTDSDPETIAPYDISDDDFDSDIGIVTKIQQGETRNLQFGDYYWRVLELKGDRALIITEDVIGERAYNTDLVYVTWETCTLRKYLNGEFLNTFTGEQWKIIMETLVSNPDNPWFGTSGGNSTNDKVFLLSLEEVVRYFGDSGQLENRPSDDTWWIDDQYNSERMVESAVWWWLRSPGSSGYAAASVDPDGYVDVSGLDSFSGVRPALWLNLESYELGHRLGAYQESGFIEG